MSKDYSEQENIAHATIPVKGSGSENFSIRVDRIKFHDDSDRNEIDIRVWSNSGRPSKRGVRLTLEQAEQVQTAIESILHSLNPGSGEPIFGDDE